MVRLNVADPRQVLVPTEEALGAWDEECHTWLTIDRLLFTRIQELLAQQGCLGSYASLRRFVHRCNWRRRQQSTVRVEATGPREVVEMDFDRLK